jgi:hypothetical protein
MYYWIHILYYDFPVQKSVLQMPLAECSSSAKQQGLDSVKILCHHFRKNWRSKEYQLVENYGELFMPFFHSTRMFSAIVIKFGAIQWVLRFH